MPTEFNPTSPTTLCGGGGEDVVLSDVVLSEVILSSVGVGHDVKSGTYLKCGTCSNTDECGHCGKCGQNLRTIVSRKTVRVRCPDGIYRGRSKKINSLRCLDCNWVQPTILGQKITKPFNLSSGQGDTTLGRGIKRKFEQI